MPRYQFDLTADVATATALVQLAMETATNFSFKIVEEDAEPVSRRGNGVKHRVPGHTTHGEILELCRVSPNNTVKRARAEQTFKRMGWNPSGITAACARLKSTGKFEVLDNGDIRMTDKNFSADDLAKHMKAIYAANRARSR